jgi:lipopolysaccharide transport system ATP-binding protein
MNGSGYQVAMFGTFDVENFGDILFPIAAKWALQKRLGSADIHMFSYREKSTDEWPFPVLSISDFPALAADYDGVIVGGGHLVRFDKKVAPGYGPSVPWVHHPTGFWLSPGLVAMQHGVPVVWNAPGCLGNIPPWAEALVRTTLENCAYISVRDQYSKQLLTAVSEKTPILTVPDTIFGITEVIDENIPSDEFEELRREWNINKPYVVIQANTTGLDYFLGLLKSHPDQFSNYSLLVLPIGPALGDNANLAEFDLPGLIKLPFLANPLMTAELICHAEGVVGSSMHLSITALSFGVPVFSSANLWEGKHAVLQEFEGIFPLPIEGAIYPPWMVSRLGKRAPGQSVIRAREQVAAHWDAIAAVLGTRRDSTVVAMNQLWFGLPGILEQTSRELELSEQKLINEKLSSEQKLINEELRRKLLAAEGEAMALRHSRSYRVMAPIRAAGRAIRGIGKENNR